MDNDSITDVVRRGYSQKRTVSEYSKKRDVWPEEEFIFNKYFINLESILDIGCGAGRTTYFLAEFGNKVVGIDISERLIEEARKRKTEISEDIDIEFSVGDANRLIYPDNSFNGAVFSYNGVGFIPRAAGKINFLKETRRILLPNGYLFFTAHNPWLLNRYFLSNLSKVLKIFLAKLFKNEIKEKEYGEKYTFKPNTESPYIDMKGKRTWMKMIEQSGFKIVYFNTKNGIEDNRNYSPFRDKFGKSNYFFFVLRK
jgi:ubiquinone/menaquinone biosynthesis C-methylase UbiE